MSTKSISVREVFEELEVEGRVTQDQMAGLEEYYKSREETRNSLWYIRGLVGFSAWIAAIFLILFLVISGIVNSESEAALSGLVFCVVAVGLRRSKSGDSDFGSQGALALVMAGQLLVLVGVGDWLDYDLAKMGLFVFVMEVVLIWFYPDQILRLIATIFAVASIYIIIQDIDFPLLFPLFAILLAFATVYLWKQELKLAVSKLYGRMYRPIGYGLAVTAVGITSFPDLRWVFEGYQWELAVGLLLILLYVIYEILIDAKVVLKSRGAISVLGGAILLAIPGLFTPGLLVAMAVLLLGFERGNRTLQGIAGAFLAYFVTLFYYDLQITLLEKSYVLVGSGLLFFSLRYLLRRNLISQEARI